MKKVDSNTKGVKTQKGSHPGCGMAMSRSPAGGNPAQITASHGSGIASKKGSHLVASKKGSHLVASKKGSHLVS